MIPQRAHPQAFPLDHRNTTSTRTTAVFNSECWSWCKSLNSRDWLHELTSWITAASLSCCSINGQIDWFIRFDWFDQDSFHPLVVLALLLLLSGWVCFWAISSTCKSYRRDFWAILFSRKPSCYKSDTSITFKNSQGFLSDPVKVRHLLQDKKSKTSQSSQSPL